MVRLFVMKSLVTSTGRNCLRGMSSSRAIVDQRVQNCVLAPSSNIIPCLRKFCNIRSLDIPLPTVLSLSKLYFSTTKTPELVTTTLNQSINENSLEPPTTTNDSETSTATIERATESPTLPPPPSTPLVYESPLGSVVSKLRTVSLTTALIGMTGVPCMIAIKGGTIPEAGILAAALLFVSGSIGSTAAIHFVFSPYVYKIEQIPIRVCSTTTTTTVAVPTEATSATSETRSDNTGSDNSIEIQDVTTVKPIKDTLLKAWTRTLFLRHHTLVFDPTIDVQPYKGLRPMCNFVAKGQPLYVHPEYVYDAKLRHAMNLDKEKSSATLAATKSNPDDDLF